MVVVVLRWSKQSQHNDNVYRTNKQKQTAQGLRTLPVTTWLYSYQPTALPHLE